MTPTHLAPYVSGANGIDETFFTSREAIPMILGALKQHGSLVFKRIVRKSFWSFLSNEPTQNMTLCGSTRYRHCLATDKLNTKSTVGSLLRHRLLDYTSLFRIRWLHLFTEKRSQNLHFGENLFIWKFSKKIWNFEIFEIYLENFEKKHFFLKFSK